ncbi:MAG: HNH endonuclease [Candidatus Peribacteraceae bacterium]|nr:HNH endonuclease [Candidatus Peribacteraceae bacterium]
MRKLTTEEFVTKARMVHGDRYSYDLVDYRNIKTNITIICPIHGTFHQIPDNHLHSNGCPSCSGKKKPTTEQFIIKAKEVYGDKYDYSLVEYKNNTTKVKIICPIHGEFEQRPKNHINGGRGCQKCFILFTRTKLVKKLPPDDGAYIDDNDDINCLCHYCGKYYKPKYSELNRRYHVMIGKIGGSYNFYCSNGCKQECSIYGQRDYPKGFKTYSNSREVQPQLRKLVMERDNYVCQRCHSTESLHCHHIEGVEINPIESADIDNCITLCDECHNDVHGQDGCTYQEYKRKECEEL